MERIKIWECVILFALCFLVLVRCDSKRSSENPSQAPQGIKSGSSAEFDASRVLRSSSSPFKRETIDPDENSRIKRVADYSDSDSDYEVEAQVPEVELEINPTIINGRGVDDLIPYQLSIRFQSKPPYGEWKHICGAVILDENTVITAAHCFGNSEDASRYRLTAGENILDVPEQTEKILQIQKIVIHPEFTDFRSGNDIAILHVDKIQFNEHARGVWLSPFPVQKLTNLTGVISGWGKTSSSSGAPVSNSLQTGNVTILPLKDCHTRLRRLRVAAAGILCAMNPETRTCNGDSGGPLVIQNYKLGSSRGNLLVGIVSFGAGNCDIKNSAGFFTEIRYFYTWIQENRAENHCEENHSPCVSGGCFQTDLKCDQNEDCVDGTDEIGCSGKNTKGPTTTTTTTEKTTTTTEKTTTTTKAPVVTPSSKPPNPPSISSCSEAMKILPSPRSKKQTIYPHGNSKSLEVLCDFETDGGGWTIIQKRTSGEQHEFNRSWKLYKNGFGSLNGNFWLGLENIRALTKNGDQELRIELEDFEGEKKWAKYSSFSISDASDFYRLSISGFSRDSTAGDSMTNPNHSSDRNLNGMRFSTRDKDNDKSVGNCARYYGAGGWWFNKCSSSMLNGLYFKKEEAAPYGQGVNWWTLDDDFSSLAKTEMKIRKRRS